MIAQSQYALTQYLEMKAHEYALTYSRQAALDILSKCAQLSPMIEAVGLAKDGL